MRGLEASLRTKHIMDSLRVRRKAAPASVSTKNHEYFYPAKIANRRMSDATDFDDTDFEASDSDEESLRQSLQSLAYDSNTTLSTPDLPTPDEARQNMINIRLDKSTVRGPEGPHLFRNSTGSTIYEPSTAEIDLYFERSPLQSEFSRSADTPNRFPFSPKTPKALATVHPDVSQVTEEEIRNWKPSQVAHWLYIAGYNDAVIERFIINDIAGSVLLSLQIDDLKELSIHSFGMRHQIMASIDHLKNTMQTGVMPPTPEPMMPEFPRRPSTGRSSPERRSPAGRSSPERSYVMSVSPNGEILSNRAFGQTNNALGTQITPAESVSIVGIEQVLPKPHSCSKGEKCSKYKRQQRMLEKLAAEFPDGVVREGAIIAGSPGNPLTAKNMLRPQSNSEPSVVASSDIFGPSPAPGPKLSEEALSEIQKLDPQETIRNFLNYQHVENHPKRMLPELETHNLPPQDHLIGLSPPTFQSHNMATNLRNLPKLTIPTSPNTEDMTTAVTTNRSMTPTQPSAGYGSPTAVQRYGPFTQTGNLDPIDVYRQGTPFSEMDVPITAIPSGPIARETSQSVPPDMQYGNLFPPYRDPISRSASVRPRAPQSLRQIEEGRPLPPIETPADLIRSPRMQQHAYSTSKSSQSSLSSDPDVTQSGYMKKRKTTRLLRHEWQDAHFTLRGTNLAMHKDERDAHRNSRALEIIDVDDYAVACSSVATSSKLTAAFKKSVLRNGNGMGGARNEPAFAFSLVPAPKEGEKKSLFSTNGTKSHHFAVKSRDERIEWMRTVMIAKIAGRKGQGEEISVNGTPI